MTALLVNALIILETDMPDLDWTGINHIELPLGSPIKFSLTTMTMPLWGEVDGVFQVITPSQSHTNEYTFDTALP